MQKKQQSKKVEKNILKGFQVFLSMRLENKWIFACVKYKCFHFFSRQYDSELFAKAFSIQAIQCSCQ